MENEDVKKRKELPKPIREEWTEDRVLSLSNYCDLIALVVYPDVTSPILAMDDIVSRYLERFAPLNPVGDKRSLALCLLAYPPYSLEVGEKLSHIIAALQGPNVKAGELRVSLPVDATVPVDLLDAMSARFGVSGGAQDGDDSEYAKNIFRLDAFSEMLDGAEISYEQNSEENFNACREELKKYRKEQLELLLGRLDEKVSDPFLQIVKNAEFNEAFDAWKKSYDLYLNDASAEVLKYRLMLLSSVVFLRIYQYKTKLECLVEHVIRREENDRQGASDSDRKTFLQAMASVDIHNTLPDMREIKGINAHADKLLKLLVGRTDDTSTLFQIFKLSKAKKLDFSSSGVLDGRGNSESEYHAKVFVMSLTNFLVYHDFDYLSFCRLAGKRYYRFAIKELEEQATLIIEPLAEVFFDGITRSFVKSNVKSILKLQAKNLMGIASVMGTKIPFGKNKVGNLLHYELDEIVRKYGFEPEAVRSFVSGLHHKDSTDKQCASIRKRVTEYRGADFWIDAYGYTGVVNDLVGHVALKPIIFPDLTEPLWQDMVSLARGSIPYLKSQIKRKIF